MGRSAFHDRLDRLGHETYESYLRSAHWQRTRRNALEHHGRACHTCGATKGLQIHHCCYRRLGEERMSDLVVLCGDCHQAAHELVKDGRAVLSNAHKVLAEVRAGTWAPLDEPKRRRKKKAKNRQKKKRKTTKAVITFHEPKTNAERRRQARTKAVLDEKGPMPDAPKRSKKLKRNGISAADVAAQRLSAHRPASPQGEKRNQREPFTPNRPDVGGGFPVKRRRTSSAEQSATP